MQCKSPEGTVVWVAGPQHQPLTPQAHSCHDKPLAATGLATDVRWHQSWWYVYTTFSVLNQLWNCYFFNSLTPLLLLNWNTGQIGFLSAICIWQPTFTIFIPYPLFFTFFFKGNMQSFQSLLMWEILHVFFYSCHLSLNSLNLLWWRLIVELGSAGWPVLHMLFQMWIHHWLTLLIACILHIITHPVPFAV